MTIMKILKYGRNKELKELDRFLQEFFDLFKVIELIIEKGFICFKELYKPENQEEGTNIYSKGISTLRREINKMVDCNYLQKESARRHKKKKSHFAYAGTQNLKIILVLLHNRLSALLINYDKIDLDVIEKLDVELLERLISRMRLYETKKSAKIHA